MNGTLLMSGAHLHSKRVNMIFFSIVWVLRLNACPHVVPTNSTRQRAAECSLSALWSMTCAGQTADRLAYTYCVESSARLSL
jgi:hypothetical protein